ncbi:glycosyltransferase family 2 protein [uncultured Flavobacterium sp.]|uniref:glycosyltransferase family 2 protein n=1 Tax=uncultured Flavobacterium sp. TaxID=165435 RepID=UPI0030EE40A1|tara:strand:+ start:24006 stop:24755 length:750 start_codon:yes stop_codon:yes gene_type:complete
MKISIITVVYNNDKTIKDAIESVLSQSYPNLEYVIIDGGSKDNTVNLIREFENRLGYFISEKDNGLYDAMNKGIRATTGDVIGILNSDDLYQDSNVIEAVMEQFNNDPELDILYGDLVYVKSYDTNKVVRNWKSKDYYNNFFENANVPPHPSLFVKKEVYNKAGLFDLDYKIAADYEFMLRVFKKHNFNSKYFNRLVVRMRLGGASNASFSSIIKQNKEVLNAWKKNNLKKPFYLIPLRVYKKLSQFIK